MKFSYEYDATYYSEITTSFTPAQDWTYAGVTSLELFFYGQADNKIKEQMHITLSDGDVSVDVPYHGDVNDLKIETWQPWRIDLQNLGLDLSNIEKLSIGFPKTCRYNLVFPSGKVFFVQRPQRGRGKGLAVVA